MFQNHRIGAILLMAGIGARFGSPTPKQFQKLGSKLLFCHALDTMLASGLFDEILLVCHPDWIQETLKLVGSGVRVVPGGATRQESSRCGIESFEKPIDIILIHDAVRPFVSERILRDNIQRAIEVGAVDTCVPSADTLVHAPGGKKIENIPNREDFLRGQTPQTFRADWIREAHKRSQGIQATDDCRLILETGKPVAVVLGEEKNFKITSEWDLKMADWIIRHLPLN